MKILLKISFFVTILFIVISCNRTPEQPIAIYPLDSAKNITDKELRLSWYSFDKDGDKMHYELLFAEDTLHFLLERNIIINNYELNTYVITGLKDSTDYLWGIKVYDDKGNYSVNDWAFTTGDIEE